MNVPPISALVNARTAEPASTEPNNCNIELAVPSVVPASLFKTPPNPSVFKAVSTDVIPAASKAFCKLAVGFDNSATTPFNWV